MKDKTIYRIYEIIWFTGGTLIYLIKNDCQTMLIFYIMSRTYSIQAYLASGR